MTPDEGIWPEWDVLMKEVEAATNAVIEAARIESDASRVHISARNRLAEAQRNVDAKIAKLRSTAPMDSPWQEKIRRERAAASDL